MITFFSISKLKARYENVLFIIKKVIGIWISWFQMKIFAFFTPRWIFVAIVQSKLIHLVFLNHILKQLGDFIQFCNLLRTPHISFQGNFVSSPPFVFLPWLVAWLQSYSYLVTTKKSFFTLPVSGCWFKNDLGLK